MLDDLLAAIETDDFDRYLRHIAAARLRLYADRARFLAANQQRRAHYGVAGERRLCDIRQSGGHTIATFAVRFALLADPVPVQLYLVAAPERTPGYALSLYQLHFSRAGEDFCGG